MVGGHCGLSEIFTWSGIMLSHIRFRKAMKVQGRSLDEVGYKSNTGIWGSYYGVIFNILVFMAQFWVALSPPGSDGKCDVESFFQSYLAAPLWIFMYLGYMIYNKDFTLLNPLDKIDLDFHRRVYDPEIMRQEDEENKERLRNSSVFFRMYNMWC